MNEKQYQDWWELHLRVALQEPLTAEEERTYVAGRAELESEEQAESKQETTNVRALQARVRELTSRNRGLAKQEELLRQQIAQLEARYFSVTGERLGLEV